MNTLLKTAAFSAILALTAASPAFAQSAGLGVSATAAISAGGASATVSATSSTKAQAHMQTIIGRADQEIVRRVGILTDLSAKVQAMAHVDAAEKAAISGLVSTQVSDLQSLQTKIDADADLATLKADVQSIGQGYRIFMLVVPQASIAVAADKAQDVGEMLSALSTKLSARINAAQAAGADVSALTASLTDLSAKLSDESTQSQAAVSETASLKPDNGDATVQATNSATLKDARSKLQTAMADLKAARADAGSLVKALAGIKASAQASGSASSSASTQ